jgi:hypothetical protein
MRLATIGTMTCHTFSINPYRRGWISTVDLLALASSYLLLLKLKKILFVFYKTSYLNEWSTVLRLPLQ